MNSLKTIIITFTVGLLSATSFAQDKLNQYKYILIPKQLALQNEPNQYNINNILKNYLTKHDFTVFIQGDSIPPNINSCDILRLDADKSGFLTTKTAISFTDCYGNNIYTSINGISRIKEFKPAYYEAIRFALKDPNIQQHQFTENPESNFIKEKDNSNIAFALEFKETIYYFETTTVKNQYLIKKDNEHIGSLKKQKDSSLYDLETNSFKGTGTFDDFGNFSLTRINPVNNAKIVDIMARVN